MAQPLNGYGAFEAGICFDSPIEHSGFFVRKLVSSRLILNFDFAALHAIGIANAGKSMRVFSTCGVL